MFTYKKLKSSDAGILAFEAHKSYNFLSAEDPNIDYRLVNFTSESKDTFSGGIDGFNHKRYFQLDHLFYKDPIFGLANLNNGVNYFDQEKRLYNKATVISISQKTTGNGIQKGTFELNNSFVDDSKGNIYIKGENIDNYPKDKDRVFYLAPVKGFKYIDLATNNDTGQPIVNAPNTLNSIKIDDSLYTNPIEYVSCSIETLDGIGCTGVNLSGSGYIKVPHSEKYNFNDDDFTICFYLKAEEVTSGEKFIFSKSFTQTIAGTPTYPKLTDNSGSFDKQEVDAGSLYPFEIVLEQGRLITLRRSDGEAISEVNFFHSPGVLEHIAFVKEGNNLKIYIDGVLRNVTTDNSKICRNKADLFIGNHGGTRSDVDSVDGIISQMMIFNKALSGTQVQKVKESISGTPYVGNIFYEQGIVTITSPKFSIGGESLITQTVSSRDISIPVTAGTINNNTYIQDLGDVVKFEKTNLTFFNTSNTSYNTTAISQSFTLGDEYSELSLGTGNVVLRPNQKTAELTLAEGIRLLPIYSTTPAIFLGTAGPFESFLSSDSFVSFPTGGIDTGPESDSTSSFATLDTSTFATDGFSVGVQLANSLETTESIALIPDTTSSLYKRVNFVFTSSVSGDPGGPGKQFDTTGNNYYSVWKNTGISPTIFPNGRSSGLVYHSIFNEITGGLADTRQHQYISASDPGTIGDVYGYPEYGPFTTSGSGPFWGKGYAGPVLKEEFGLLYGESYNGPPATGPNAGGSNVVHMAGGYHLAPWVSDEYDLDAMTAEFPYGRGLSQYAPKRLYDGEIMFSNVNGGADTNIMSNQIMNNEAGINQQIMEEILSSSIRQHLGGHFSDKPAFRNEYWDRLIANELAMKAIANDMIGSDLIGDAVWTEGDMGNICNGVAIQSGININGTSSLVITGSYGTVGCYTTGLKPYRNSSVFHHSDPYKALTGSAELPNSPNFTLNLGSHSEIVDKIPDIVPDDKHVEIGKLATYKKDFLGIKDDIPLGMGFISASSGVADYGLVAYFSSSTDGLDTDGSGGDGTLIEGMTSGSAQINSAGDDLLERPDVLFFKLIFDLKTNGNSVKATPSLVIKQNDPSLGDDVIIKPDRIIEDSLHWWDGQNANDAPPYGYEGQVEIDSTSYITCIFNFRVPLRSAIQSFAADYLTITSSFPPTSDFRNYFGEPIYGEAAYETEGEYEEIVGFPHQNYGYVSSNTNRDDPTYADSDGWFRPEKWINDYINILSNKATIYPKIDFQNPLVEEYGAPTIRNIRFGCFNQTPNPGFKNQLEIMTDPFELYEIEEVNTGSANIVAEGREEWLKLWLQTADNPNPPFTTPEYDREYSRRPIITKGKKKALKLDIKGLNTTGSAGIFNGLTKGQKKISEFNTFTGWRGSGDAYNWNDKLDSAQADEFEWAWERSNGAKHILGESPSVKIISDNQFRSYFQKIIPLFATSSYTYYQPSGSYIGGPNINYYTGPAVWPQTLGSSTLVSRGDFNGLYGRSPLNLFARKGGFAVSLPNHNQYYNYPSLVNSSDSGLLAGVSYHCRVFPGHHNIIKNDDTNLEYESSQHGKANYFKTENEDLYLKIQLKPFPYSNASKVTGNDEKKSLCSWQIDEFYWTSEGFEGTYPFTYPMPVKPSGSYKGDVPFHEIDPKYHVGGSQYASIDRSIIPDWISYNTAKEQFFAPYTFISGNMEQVGSVHGYVNPTSLWDKKANLKTEQHLEAFLYSPMEGQSSGGVFGYQERVFPFFNYGYNFWVCQNANLDGSLGEDLSILDTYGEFKKDSSLYDIYTALSKTRFRQIYDALCRTNYRAFFTVVAGDSIKTGNIHAPSNTAHRAFTKAFQGFSIGEISASIYTEQNKYKINFDSSSISTLSELSPFINNTDINIDAPSSSLATTLGHYRTGDPPNNITPIQSPRPWRPINFRLSSSSLFGFTFRHPDQFFPGNISPTANSPWSLFPQTWPEIYENEFFANWGDLISGSDGQYIHLGEHYYEFNPIDTNAGSGDIGSNSGQTANNPESAIGYFVGPNNTQVLNYTSSNIIVIEDDALATFNLMGIGGNFVSASYKLNISDWLSDGAYFEIDRIFAGDGSSNNTVTDSTPIDKGIGSNKFIQVDVLKSGSGGETHIISKTIGSGSYLQNVFESTPVEDRNIGFVSHSEAIIVNFTVVSALNTPVAIQEGSVFRIGQMQFNYLDATTTINANPGTTTFPQIPDGFSSYRLDFTSPHTTPGAENIPFSTGSVSVNVISVNGSGTSIVVDESLFITASLTPDDIDTYYAEAINPIGLPTPALKAELLFNAKVGAVYTFEGLAGSITTANDTSDEGIGIRVVGPNNTIIAENFEPSGPINLSNFITSNFTDITFATNGTAKLQIFTSGSSVDPVQATQGRDFNIQLYNGPLISFTEISGSRVSTQAFSFTEDERTANQLVITSSHDNSGGHNKFNTGSFSADIAGFQSVAGGYKIKLATPVFITASSDITGSKHEYVYYNSSNTLQVGDNLSDLSNELIGSTFTYTDPVTNNTLTYSIESVTTNGETSTITLNQPLIAIEPIEIEALYVVNTSGDFNVKFKNTHLIFENEFHCTVDENEFTHTLNASARKYKSTDHGELADFATGSNFRPYVTTIGLYNDEGELLVVGKLAQPIRMSEETDTTFVVRYDT